MLHAQRVSDVGAEHGQGYDALDIRAQERLRSAATAQPAAVAAVASASAAAASAAASASTAAAASASIAAAVAASEPASASAIGRTPQQLLAQQLTPAPINLTSVASFVRKVQDSAALTVGFGLGLGLGLGLG